MEDKDSNGGFIGGLKKAVNMYVQQRNTSVKDGLTGIEQQNPIKPIINKSLKDRTILGLKPLTYVAVSFSIVALCGIAILSLKNK